MTSPRATHKFFSDAFPDALKLIDRFEESFAQNPTGQMVTVRAKPWNLGGQIQLIGDAAHAIVPFFGQGLNCGFEDCTIFNQCLAQNKNLEEVFSSFSNSRMTDANAIADLALENFVEMRDKVAQPKFLLEKEIEKILMRKFPADYISKYSMVTFSRTPYQNALKSGKIQEEILNQLSAGLLDPQKVDLVLAEKLIQEKLKPLNSEGI